MFVFGQIFSLSVSWLHTVICLSDQFLGIQNLLLFHLQPDFRAVHFKIIDLHNSTIFLSRPLRPLLFPYE